VASFSDKPWGSMSESDYKDANQFCAACLIDLSPAGQEKTKANCTLPVKEPICDLRRDRLLRRTRGAGSPARRADQDRRGPGSRAGHDPPRDHRRGRGRYMIPSLSNSVSASSVTALSLGWRCRGGSTGRSSPDASPAASVRSGSSSGLMGTSPRYQREARAAPTYRPWTLELGG
jgi:hypothetical protein